MKLNTKYALAGALFLVLIGLYCRDLSEPAPVFRNLAPGVEYVGMATCRSCHSAIYDSFIQTGMGQSFGRATREKSAAVFDENALVYDSASHFFYFPHFKDSTFYVTEFRLENGDTTHKRTEKISYIVGSGQHTNSHILDLNGYLFQAPVTFYTQSQKWDMAPGFKHGNNTRFGRALSPECITCHNHYPEFVPGSFNKYARVPEGIECERCHGPGEIHVREKLAGIVVDTAAGADYSIVNPKRLPRELQMDLCQRCHLQGVAVLAPGKTFFDFKPGMKLSDVMNVFLPRYADSHEKFIMASQADRLRLSACYKNSELSCLTCHNPHKSVRFADHSNFNRACLKCHESLENCSAPANEKQAHSGDCVACHMPKSGSIDIPHVRITDHFINKTPDYARKNAVNSTDTPEFYGLKILTKDKATPLEMAKGYLELYDRYVSSPVMLDSAWYYLRQSSASFEAQFEPTIHYFFAREDYQKIVETAAKWSVEKTSEAWTAYRVGQAWFYLQNYVSAAPWLEKATRLAPFNLDFWEKYAVNLVQLKKNKAARTAFEYVLKENEKRPVAWCNLGYLYALEGQFEEAEKRYDEALALDPDYEQALINKAAILFLRKERGAARRLLRRALQINPQNEQARQALSALESRRD
ncbi:MAG: tetratricopeptide repeat protein [Bacteroidetes bacterium]|nr:MAG: tetratricopeptide repeat protein [Bacteroidota bacterium]